MRLAAFVPMVAVLASCVDLASVHAGGADARIILPKASYAWYADDRFGGLPHWTPTRDMVAVVDAGLGDYLHASDDQAVRDIAMRLDDYGRQYLGLTAQGRRVILVNAFCSPKSWPERRTKFVSLQGGGTCFFKASYDVASGRFVDLMVHGAR